MPTVVHTSERVLAGTQQCRNQAAAKYARVSQAGESKRTFFVQDNDVGKGQQ